MSFRCLSGKMRSLAYLLYIMIVVVVVVMVTTAHAVRIAYPSAESEFPKDCIQADGSAGVCATTCTANEMSGARALKICYFLEGEVYYCCHEQVTTTTTTTTMRTTTSTRPATTTTTTMSTTTTTETTTSKISILQKIDLTERPAVAACSAPETQFIIRGSATQPMEFLYMETLGWQDPKSETGYNFKCGGVVIWKRFVLTAAHCAIVEGLEPDVVLVGGVNLTEAATKRLYKVENVYIHPDYDSDYVYHDIALLQLEEQHDPLKKACLWPDDELLDVNFTAIGYGHTSFAGTGSNQLLKAFFSLVPNEKCQKFYEAEYSVPEGLIASQLCAKDQRNRSDTCQGDSGGPLIVQTTTKFIKRSRPYVVAITSFGQGCAFSPPGVYTRVSAYIDWIESIVWPNGCCQLDF